MSPVSTEQTPRASIVLNRYQREWLRGEFAREVQTPRQGFDAEPPRRSYLVADALWHRFSSSFVAYSLDGSDVAEFTLPVLRVVRRYRQLCYLAYIGERSPW